MQLLKEIGRWILGATLLVIALKLAENIHISIETAGKVIHINAMLFLLIVLPGIWILGLVMRLLRYFFKQRIPDTRRQHQQILANYEAAVQCVFEGRYQKALQHVEQGEHIITTLNERDWIDRRILFKLIAARACLLDRKLEQAEQLVEDPLLQRPAADTARCLIGAQVALERKQPEKALEYLDYLEKHQGLHRQAYQLKLRALQRAGQWARINETIEMMQRRGFIESVAATHLERVAAVHRVRECEAHPKSLQALWNGLPEMLQQHPDLLREYLDRADTITEFDSIVWLFKAVERSLDQQWDDALWMAYALHPAQFSQRALSHAETWLTQHPTNTQLLYGLGLICQRLKLWGKARSYLEAAQSIYSDRKITYALINLFKAEGHPEEAEALLMKTLQSELEAAA
ncbi:MAG: hypothetical protein V4525_09035 [Pseudomonadota bacterium]